MAPSEGSVEQALAAALGHPVTVSRRVRLGGGSIAVAERLETNAGTFVLKSHDGPPPGLFATEANGLEALRASGTSLTIPRVISAGDDPFPHLLLEYLDSGRSGRRPGFDEELGHGLAGLHRATHARFGFDADNYCGATPQVNAWRDQWVDFYREARLASQIDLAHRAGLLGARDVARCHQLLGRLDDLIAEPPEGPALIHGDLWSGNLHVDAAGGPALLDPAVSFSHREADLGMMTLFGGFTARVFGAYDEAFPLEPGWRERTPLYQLYHLLNHLNLFGAGYHAEVMAIVGRFVA